MMRRFLAGMMALLIVTGLLAVSSKVTAAASTPPLNPNPVPDNAWDLMPELNVGWNLGNSLENQTFTKGFCPASEFASLETRRNNPVTTKAMIDAVAEAGFSSIRIPVSFYNHLLESKPARNGTPRPGRTIDPEWLDRIEEVVRWAYDNELYVIINNHHDTSMWDEHMSWIHADRDTYAEDVVHYENLWRQVAERFNDYDHHLIFQSTGEIVNTKRKTLQGDLRFDAYHSYQDFQVAHDYNQKFIETVRKTGSNNKDRFLILETYAANAEPVFIDQCFYKTYEDAQGVHDRLIFGVHCYHDDPEEMRAVMKGLAVKSVQYDMPYIIDECGTKYSLNQNTRIEVARALSEESARYGAAVMVWDDGLGEFGLFDRPLTMAQKKPVGYRYVPGDTSYKLKSYEIVGTLVTAKNHIKPLTREQLRALYDNRYQVRTFQGLDKSNAEILTSGHYAQTHTDAANPVSELIPTPAHYAAFSTYVFAEGADFTATMPAGMKVVVREHDRNRRYLGTVVVEPGGTYYPSESAFYLGIGFRYTDTTVRLKDYIKAVNDGYIRLQKQD